MLFIPPLARISARNRRRVSRGLCECSQVFPAVLFGFHDVDSDFECASRFPGHRPGISECAGPAGRSCTRQTSICAELLCVSRRGIPGTAMPGSSTVSEKEAANIVAYLRTMDSTTTSGVATGDPKKGEALY